MNNYHEQGIEVYVRIRPIPYGQQDQRRSVVLSQSEDNTIVVESNNKKEYFSFDYIASENTHQQELFQRVGEPVVGETLKGYNCCVFSYGQTGAGKTYSILGNPAELVQDPFSDQRGLLPRILEQMFSRINNPCNGFQSVTVNCSYLQIYNEQIIDLMTKQSKNLPIREDIRRGVYVDGLTQLPIKSYQDVLNIIIKGLAVRKTASTFMNSQSSRSHTIFTMMLNIQFEQQNIKKNLKSKIHIIDLAGSERTKLTKVEGERLKQGCNINKSLLTLSNVICSLADAGKKKKYIPFRDSKLTFFLKDSLGGNSKTKLLANISPKVAYFGDTISTLMFAKRAKIIKTKVQPNENIADNFESLRTQIRKLRQQLAQTKFIKPPQSTMRVMSPIKNKTQNSNLFLTKDHIFLPTQSFLEMSQYEGQFQEQFKIFMQNEMSYRSIIENNFKVIQGNQKYLINSGGNLKSLFEQKKKLQKTVNHQQKLLNNFPAFTKIFSQNMQLKTKIKQIQMILEEVIIETKQKSLQIQTLQNTILILNAQIQNLQDSHERSKQQITPIHSRRQMNSPIQRNLRMQSKRNSSSQLEIKVPELKLGAVKRKRKTSLAFTHRNGFKDIVGRQNAIIDQYQAIIQDLKNNFSESIQNLKSSYHGLQQLYQQQQRQKHQIRKNKRKQPEAEALSNQNQYLKLNIMQLETQIKKFQQQLFKKQVQVKTIKDDKLLLQFKLENMQKLSHQNGIKQSELQSLIQKIKVIKLQAQKAESIMNQQMEKDCIEINELNYKLSKMIKENYTLLSKNEALTQQNSIYKGKISELASIDQSIIQFKQGMQCCTTTIDMDEDFTFQKTLHEDIVKNLQKLTIQKQRLNRQIQENQKQKVDQKSRLQKASSIIRNLTQQLIFFKDQSTHYSLEAETTLRQLEIIRKDKIKSQEKSKLFEIQLSQLKKQIDKNQNISKYIKKQFLLQPLEFVQEARHLKERNSLLNQQNKRLRESIQDIQNKNNLLKNSKSLSSLSTLPLEKPISSGLQKIIQEKQEKIISSVPISQRGDLTFRKKQQSKLTNIPQKQKEKSSLQFKTKTFFGQQGRNIKKNK